jgi:hypothetical protein
VPIRLAGCLHIDEDAHKIARIPGSLIPHRNVPVPIGPGAPAVGCLHRPDPNP